ncbi:T9SS type A sorting domain-containing protein [Rufibacter sp. DG15C]|uniref:T9SS type A sorting domain-containing protein n=1 Tax=Rufibacter sp. DG15C TaxID=1379909 RepID=UPI0009E923E0|nr:T9SS type A sorting domain-containing protein [Rufibacter sp. DG15C]
MENLSLSYLTLCSAGYSGNCKESQVKTVTFWKTALAFIGLLLVAFTSSAQVVLPPESRCTSKDLELVDAFLDVPACQSCDPGDLITAPLKLSIANKTGSTRTSFAFWGDIVIKSSYGNVVYQAQITGCKGPIIKTDTTTLPFEVIVIEVKIDSTNSGSGISGTQISYECGSTIDLTNLFLAWTDASPKSTCSTLKSNLIAPKCGTLPAIAVSTGLTASSVPTNVTCSGDGNGAIDLSISGGSAPYTYAWVASNGGVIPTGQEDNQDLTDLVPGTYVCTVTDGSGCQATSSETITQPDEVLRPAVTVVEPSICALVPYGTVTVTSPLGADYEYSNDGGNDWQDSVTFHVNAGAGFSITVRSKSSGCVSPATDCDNYQSTDRVVPTSIKAPNSSGPLKEEMMVAYPIPFSDRTTVEFKSKKGEEYVINLYDMSGTMVKQLKSGKAKANEVVKVEVDGRGIQEGVYLARKISKSGVSSVKLLKKN